MPATDRVRSLLVRAAVAAAIVGVGLAVRAFTDGAFAKYAGVALYAAMVYVLVTMGRPAASARGAFLLAAGICVGVELFQLTPVPAQLAARHPVFALVLGTTFHWPDLLAYLVGAAGAAAVDSLQSHARS